MKVRLQYIEWVGEAMAAGARQRKACEILEISVRTLQQWRKDPRDDGRKANRFSKKNALTKKEKRHIFDILCSPEFRNLTPHQIVPILADRGEYYGSESTFYRILHENGLMRHRSRAKAPERSRPEEYAAYGPNQVWTWDITYFLSLEKGVYYYLYLVTDIWDRSIVAWAIHERESGELGAELFREACLREGIQPGQLVVHQDNGAPMTSAEFLSFLDRCTITPSFSRPGISDDNAFSESLFRTLKYRPSFPGRFEDIAAAIMWMLRFVEWYGNEHRHSSIAFVTTRERREGKDIEILKHRDEVYKKAKEKNPERWSCGTRNWERPAIVVLNPKISKKNRQESVA